MIQAISLWHKSSEKIVRYGRFRKLPNAFSPKATEAKKVHMVAYRK